ncbi:class II histone deacetylase [Salibacterium salarium]|uniref:Class II histone deacetylase n=1 Tax=Salibacterium salarium TaxID=284579 RepID=A0A428MW44_9BACI|nr:class II histone deacetylase [Salibacterium salarium]RSL30314.1 class II histone deacetylase [Salibacterium salarium]
MQQTGFIYDESYFWHDTGNGAICLRPGGWVEADVYGENPETKRRVKNLLDRSGFIRELTSIEPFPVSKEQVEQVHSSSYVDKVKHLSETSGGDAGEVAIVGIDSYDIALLAAGGAATGIDAVMQEKVQNVYALTRPPGHHAERNMGMGFCLFNNVAIAAHYARKQYGIERIMILDWDVHHGNGTESAFYDDPNTLFVSIHQEYNFPPDRGLIEHTGAGDGEGYNVNIPLPAGTGNAGYLHALKELTFPIAEQFQPELILVSAGQDPSVFDPLAQMMVTADGFGSVAAEVKQLAERICDGRLVVCHEGGYSSSYVPFCTLRIIEALSGRNSKVTEDPFYVVIQGLPSNKLEKHQKEAVQKAAALQNRYWDL